MNKTVKFAIFAMFSPLVFGKDIKLNAGDTIREFFPDISIVVQEAFARAGHSIDLVNIPGERAFVMFKSGELDADVMRLADFRDSVADAVPVPVVLTKLNLLALVKSDSPYTSKADLIGTRMASVRGIKVQAIIAQQMQAVVIELSNVEGSAQTIAAGRADFLPVTQEIANTLIASGLSVRVIDDPLLQIPFYTWVTSANADLVPGLEAALKELKAEGRF